ncbi:MAG: hypothetical protein GKR88_02095 [Flavobacteriaceae bacterium]|nr:MAG: hypothetical protein GKR88_02095 [Flavobacteriaceae bacterium]
MNVIEKKGVIASLKKRNLVAQYLKAKDNILAGNYTVVDLKKRKPKSANVWYFRITRKYRALAEKKENTLYVFYISDHQE